MEYAAGSYLALTHDLYLVESSEIQVHAALLNALAGVAVAATPDANLQAANPCRPHRCSHVRRRFGPGSKYKQGGPSRLNPVMLLKRNFQRHVNKTLVGLYVPTFRVFFKRS